MKIIVSLGLVMLLAATILLDKHVEGLGMVNEDTHSKKIGPAPLSKPALLKPELPTGQKSVAETPEMKNAKIMAELRSSKEKIKPLMDGLKDGGNAGLVAAIMERDKAEWLRYLSTLGYSAEVSEQVFQMFKNLIVVQTANLNSSPSTSDSVGGYLEVDQVRNEFISKVGMENYYKVKHQFATQADRNLINEYQDELGNQSKPLTDAQRAAIVEAMFESANGKPSPLQSRADSLGDKIAYIDRVKERLKPVLDTLEIASVYNYLKKIAEETSKPLPSMPKPPPGNR